MIENLLGAMAGVLIFFLYIIYYFQVKRRASVPNPATWLIWLLVHALNTVSYFILVRYSIYQSLIALVTTFCLLLFFIYFATKREFSNIGKIEDMAIISAIVIAIWWGYGAKVAFVSNSLQLVIFISYIPTIIGILTKKNKEAPWAWLVGVIAYMLQIISLVKAGNAYFDTLLFPVVNGILGNGTIMFISFSTKTKNKR